MHREKTIMPKIWDPRLPNKRTPKRRIMGYLWDSTGFIVQPWSMHCLTTFLFMFVYHIASFVCCILAVLLIAWGFITMSRERSNPKKDGKWTGIGGLMVVSAALGSFEGYQGFIEFTGRFYAIGDGREYREVEPTELAISKSDAGSIFWAPDTIVDVTRSVGLRVDHTFCVAPIANRDDLMANVEFWAVGRDCCKYRSEFSCGNEVIPAKIPQSVVYYTNAGVFGNLTSSGADYYLLAVEMAKAEFGILSRGDVMLVEWTRSIGETKKAMLRDAILFFVLHSAYNLLINILFGLVVFCYTLSKARENNEAAALKEGNPANQA
mmetsp:Transcript_32357/g.84005  ORF Transcript_32357/g.84005 Transcript_32357/m.84005 type:complete len:322 (-) Transcript_32357:27-992(-)